MSEGLKKLRELTNKIVSYEVVRQNNIKTLKTLYEDLGIKKKVDSFDDLFEFKAMNITGLGLGAEDLGLAREGKYVQIIAARYEQDKNSGAVTARKRIKNENLGYFGRAEKIKSDTAKKVLEFVFRWRLEKNFRGVDNYKNLLKCLQANLSVIESVNAE